jgi:hypothetical protein
LNAKSHLIGFLAPRSARSGEKLAGPVAYLILAIGAAILWFGGKALYDHSVISKHDAKVEAKTAKADRKADNHAADQRRTDDARATSEAQEIKEAINEAGNDPAARRAAYYECVRKQQSARSNRKPSPDC